MRRAVRYALSAVGLAAMAMAGLADASFPAAAASTANVTVASMHPARGEVVGVAQPVVVRFTARIADRAAAEQTITVSSPRDKSGRFRWVNDHVVQWNPDGLWPAHTTVTVMAGPASTEFETGPAVIGVADISAHTFTVSIDEQVVREMPASLGKPGFDTPVGTFAALEKQRKVVFDSRTIGIPLDDPEGYVIDGEYAVRVTWGGVYVHSAPWSVGSQGSANVSHGCINLSPENAAWYFDTVRNGDPIIVQS